MSDDYFGVVGSRPSSVASNYTDFPSSPSNNIWKGHTHVNKNLNVTRNITVKTPNKGNRNNVIAKGPVKALQKHKPSYVDETLFGSKEPNLDNGMRVMETNEIFGGVGKNDMKKPEKTTPRPGSAKKGVHTYKSKGNSSYVDETLFGTSNKHLATDWSSMEVDHAKASLNDGNISTRDLLPNSGRYSSRLSRPPSRTSVGDGPMYYENNHRPNSRNGSNKKIFNPSYVDESLFGQKKLEDPSFPAPWEKPEDLNKPRPLFCDSSNYTKIFEHESQESARPKSRNKRPQSASGKKPAWR